MENKLELRQQISDTSSIFSGNIGELTRYMDSTGKAISIGDIVSFTWRNKPYFALVAYDADEQRCYIDGFHHTTETDNAFNFADIKIYRSYLEARPGEKISRFTVMLVTAAEPPKRNSVFDLASLAAQLMANDALFIPANPTTDLLYSLFGGSDFHPCPYEPHRVDEILFRSYVKRWSPKKGHHFFMFRDGSNWSPLAYLRIDEDMDHGPSSYLDRVTHAYYFCEHLNARFEKVMEQITTPSKRQPRSEELSRNAIELALTVMWDVKQK